MKKKKKKTFECFKNTQTIPKLHDFMKGKFWTFLSSLFNKKCI